MKNLVFAAPPILIRRNNLRKSALPILFFLMVVTMASASGCGSSGEQQLVVSAAISLSNAFEEIKAEFEKNNPDSNIVYNFAASGVLQAQIEQGAPVDVFASASEKQMDVLEERGLLVAGSRADFAQNEVVLIVPGNSVRSPANFQELVKPEVIRIAVGNPEIVPAGQYAREVLTNLGLWDKVQEKLVMAENVRQALAYVEKAEVDSGIVYYTDALISRSVVIAASAPPGSHRPIVYPIAVIRGSKEEELARRFISFIVSQKGQGILQKYGFLPGSS
ncbi:molybdate transport system substrate-binding protein [Candidatus Hakubella thermalkaliphila]|uniref:Molybdate transport system substrate-binding protein n=1 Tax=Candidatus Hakubella thermalkaliphila TaxID=2754717 RepID=A0A6V8PR01_9ACTN|nr:molybdate ABC transporter substrate-binding protein [Candidatus Hakubella thermalkaliphila]GFP34480.1 molybdate transport system substrate-binding protein [Candidatus Hakubella thermalkaliphila]